MESMPELSLSNKIAFITGASAGIGLATARAFAAQGARLILAARRRDRLEAERATFTGAPDIFTIQLDVTDHAAVDQAIYRLPAEWKAIDILVNNAGLSRGLDKLHEGKRQDWEEMIDTNVKGLLYVTRAVVPGMVT
jgi:NADP-dependent 3-hydroxy acid dehydrogenase YdfG